MGGRGAGCAAAPLILGSDMVRWTCTHARKDDVRAVSLVFSRSGEARIRYNTLSALDHRYCGV